MKNKFLIFLIIFIFILFQYQKIDYMIHSNRIDKIFYNSEINKYNYIGYIEIDSLHIKREILMNSEKNMINSVVLYQGKNLDENHIVLAGHAIDNVFGNLKNININDIINIKTFDNNYKYIVVEKEIVYNNDYNSILEGELVLITCKNYKQRYIIKAKKIG